MSDLEWLSYRRQAFAQFRQQYDLPPAWFAAIEYSLREGDVGQCAYSFDFDYKAYLDDDRFVQILSLEEDDSTHLFALWRSPGRELAECPIIQSAMNNNGDGTCSPNYTQEAIAQNLDEFLRLLATGVAGRDPSTLSPIAIDSAPFQRIASAFASLKDAEAAMNAAALAYDGRLPAPKGWGSEI